MGSQWRAELVQCAEYELCVFPTRSDPNVKVSGRPRHSVNGHGMSADNQILHLSTVQFLNQVEEISVQRGLDHR